MTVSLDLETRTGSYAGKVSVEGNAQPLMSKIRVVFLHLVVFS
jgi:hypothetical protein